MEIKQKSKITNMFKIIVFTLILLILMLGFSTNAKAVELFSESVPLSFHGVPRKEIGPLVYCSKKGYGTEVYIDCSYNGFAYLLGSGQHRYSFFGFGAVRHTDTYTILGEDPITRTTYDWSGGPMYYNLAEEYRQIWNSNQFRNSVSKFVSKYLNYVNGLGSNLYSTYVNGTNYYFKHICYF